MEQITKDQIASVLELPENQIRYESVSGGDINNAFQVHTPTQSFFLKTPKTTQQYPQLYQVESNGLLQLKQCTSVRVPKVIAVNDAFLLLEWINEHTAKDADNWFNAGSTLAQIHQRSNDHFGLDHDNYIGTLLQNNSPHSNWSEFYINCRLIPQLKSAVDQQLLDAYDLKNMERLFNKMEQFFPIEPPALLHGDLWSGNQFFDRHGQWVLFDPACYYGHREIDLAMTQLFGGFHPDFYRGYHEQYPLEKDWGSRIDIAQLYPILVHVNLFGYSYVVQVRDRIKPYI